MREPMFWFGVWVIATITLLAVGFCLVMAIRTDRDTNRG